ncbi:MAG: cytosolic protein [Candidatus Fischerbacteria bacterium RBG_13_37_8]|uniref:Cytosolic protein n=1 Tax=Candidatus Fischerbacteria bacterium RBG_13_37_8 TaxID=1817863 RepID=A0A1F5VWX5_9BACT|nr:MAG: cytosolic protein [Candidatus Fischerbacteria bacterium RBG_13_37_8]
MRKIKKTELNDFINTNIQSFHDRRIENLKKLELKSILARKNPYLYKAKNILTSEELIRYLLDAHLSSQEEGIFGDFLEELAIFVCSKVFNGRKSTAEGIDLEFSKENIEYIVSIKSGPNWGNSQQIKRMRENFKKAKKIKVPFKRSINIVAVNGCCYGIDDSPNKGDYLKLCGQRFWEFITGDSEFYQRIIEPLGYKAKEKNDYYNKHYSNVINLFVLEFSEEYCKKDGSVDWEKIVKHNSGLKKNLQLHY